MSGRGDGAGGPGSGPSRAALGALRLVRRLLIGTLEILAALILLFEEWGWRPLSELIGYLARLRPWARVELWIAGLPPYAALVVFVLPSAILLPVKIAGLWLLAKGQAVLAALLLAGAKVLSTALVARIFLLTKPALMQLRWFAWVYGRVMPWKDALFARIRASWVWRYGRMVKTKVRAEARKIWVRYAPIATQWRATIATAVYSAAKTACTMARTLIAALRSRLGS